MTESTVTLTGVAVIGTPDERWGERVTAVVNLKPGEEMNGEELLEWCRDGSARVYSLTSQGTEAAGQ